MSPIFAALSFVTIVGAAFPYMLDVVKGKAKPARATRIMLLIILILVLFQQHQLGSGWSLIITIAELIVSILLLFFGLRYGVGGLDRRSKICYVLLAVDVIFWLTTKNALIALHLSVLADFIASWPTFVKTWHDPKSETPLFWWSGVIAPVFAIISEQSRSYKTLLFPLYLILANGVVVLMIYGLHQRKTVQAAID